MSVSRIEEDFFVQMQWAKLPAPEREYRAISGRAFRFDFAWPDSRLLVEVQGGVWGVKKGNKTGHNTGVGINRDCEKSNLATLAGWRVLSVTTNHIRTGQALRWVQKALDKPVRTIFV